MVHQGTARRQWKNTPCRAGFAPRQRRKGAGEPWQHHTADDVYVEKPPCTPQMASPGFGTP